MFKTFFYSFLFFTLLGFAQQPYYTGINFSLEGEDLYDELQQLVAMHNTSFNYGNARDILIFTDENPQNFSTVLLVYGYNDDDGNCTTDRTRDKNDFGGNNCQYNREHVFPRSLSEPSMGSPNNSATGIVADPHNIRACDQQMNNNRGDRKFQNGSGNAGPIGSDAWYPGDEWKGDIARMMMYMYLRYGEQCLPSLVGNGALQGDTQMLQVFLQWNVEDPVTLLEDQRNEILQGAYGNRNPFIDNPYLATIIWGGPEAEDRWQLSTQQFSTLDFALYPNPATGNTVSISTSSQVESLVFYNLQGKAVLQVNQPHTVDRVVEVNNIPSGFYLVQLQTPKGTTTKKLVVK
jgi:hypothetical protein